MLLVLLCLPFSLVGGIWLIYLLGYPVSVAVVVGFIALAGVASEFGVVTLLFLDKAISSFQAAGKLTNPKMLREAIIQGAVLRLRPKMMTVSVIIAGLLPVMYGQDIGTDVMKRIAAPLIGGMVTAPILSLIIIPVAYLWWRERQMKDQARGINIGVDP
jgi:Cu(I)/Ag(I) efflux system membrane protein CusA/SilA